MNLLINFTFQVQTNLTSLQCKDCVKNVKPTPDTHLCTRIVGKYEYCPLQVSQTEQKPLLYTF